MSLRNTLLQLSNPLRSACPPDGYRYVFPEDGYLVHAWTYADWIQFGLNHLEANKGSQAFPDHIEKAELENRMQDQLCRTLPPGWCLYDDPSRPRPSTSLSYNDVAAGLKTFARWVLGGMKYVVQDEAERRALICSRCYLNVNIQGCSGCQQAVEETVRNRKTKLDPVLRACAVCKCFLKAKVHWPIKTLNTVTDKNQEMYPSFCWNKIGGENYKEDDEQEKSSARTQTS